MFKLFSNKKQEHKEQYLVIWGNIHSDNFALCNTPDWTYFSEDYVRDRGVWDEIMKDILDNRIHKNGDYYRLGDLDASSAFIKYIDDLVESKVRNDTLKVICYRADDGNDSDDDPVYDSWDYNIKTDIELNDLYDQFINNKVSV